MRCHCITCCFFSRSLSLSAAIDRYWGILEAIAHRSRNRIQEFRIHVFDDYLSVIAQARFLNVSHHYSVVEIATLIL